mmetsp:Transcript_29470/g.31653  ORF Transcript_29470/g.31653 Transcript_29470/m.31653 type:complete len:80 (+) Transcript_29470:278-517(+)
MANNNRKKKKPETTVAMATSRQQQHPVVVDSVGVGVTEEDRIGNRSKKKKGRRFRTGCYTDRTRNTAEETKASARPIVY